MPVHRKGKSGALMSPESDNYIMYHADTGCRYFAKCTECPLVKCVDEFITCAGDAPTAISKAVVASWEAGLRHPEFIKLLRHKKRSKKWPIPDDVLQEATQ